MREKMKVDTLNNYECAIESVDGEESPDELEDTERRGISSLISEVY